MKIQEVLKEEIGTIIRFEKEIYELKATLENNIYIYSIEKDANIENIHPIEKIVYGNYEVARFEN